MALGKARVDHEANSACIVPTSVDSFRGVLVFA